LVRGMPLIDAREGETHDYWGGRHRGSMSDENIVTQIIQEVKKRWGKDGRGEAHWEEEVRTGVCQSHLLKLLWGNFFEWKCDYAGKITMRKRRRW